MKRLLIFFALLGALLLPQAAMASSYAFGPGALNDEYGLASNIEALINDVNFDSSYLSSIQSLDPNTKYNFTLFAYSNYVRDTNGLAIYYDNANIKNANTLYHIGEYLAGELTVEYMNGNLGRVEHLLFSELENGLVLEKGSINFTLLGDTVAYDFGVGTIFFGYTIPGSGTEGPDFIIAASPSSAVPVPAAVWLLGSGLAGMGALRRKLR